MNSPRRAVRARATLGFAPRLRISSSTTSCRRNSRRRSRRAISSSSRSGRSPAMSQEDLWKAIGRSQADLGFSAQIRNDPERSIAESGYKLDPHEVEQLKKSLG